MYPDCLGRSEKPWLELYPAGTAETITPHFDNVVDLFAAAAAQRPEHEAIRYFGHSKSYAALARESDALASYLQACGIEPGARVVVALQNTPEFVVALLAAWKAGAVPLPVNPMYRRFELAKIFADARPKALFCEPADAAEMRGGLADAGCDATTILAEPAALEFAPFARQVAAEGKLLDAAIAAHMGQIPRAAPRRGGDLGLLMYTSGTTGAPKGAMLRQESLASNAQLLRDWCGLNRASRIWAVAPFFHITGIVCHILVSFSAQATLVMHYRFEPRLALDIIRQTRPTYTIGAITAFNALMNSEGASAADFASFDRIYSGGAPIPPALANAFKQRLGVAIHPSYGMTETTAPTHLTPFGAVAPGDPVSGALAIGIPVPGADAAIVDENDKPLPAGEIGELVMRGPQIMSGYWQMPEESAATLKHGWMHSGDVGFRDEAGWFFLVDRKKDMIVASGFKVWPREVEDVLYMHPAVREAAVIGIADDYRGENVKAYVSFVAGAEATIADLTAHCRARLASYKVPRVFEVLGELPKTVTGKIQRVALRQTRS